MTGQQNRLIVAVAIAAASCLMVGMVAMDGPGGTGAAARLAASKGADFRQRHLPDREEFSEVAVRPLFTPTRKPTPPPPPKPIPVVAQPIVVPPPPPPPASRLLAVVIGPARRAAVLELTNGETVVLLQGEQVGGWTLAGVWPDHAVLKSPLTDTTLAFQVHGSKGPIETMTTSNQTGLPVFRRR